MKKIKFLAGLLLILMAIGAYGCSSNEAQMTPPPDPPAQSDTSVTEPETPEESEVPAEPETPVAPEESLYFYDNHFTSYGPSISELIGGNDWYRVTPVDLSEDGVYTYPLVAANRYTIGTVTFKVDTGSLTISYRITAWNVDVNEIELKIYGSKAAMAEGNAIVATIGEAINIGETFGNDTNVIVSLILTGNFDALATNVVDLVIVNAEIAEMIAAMD